MSHKQRAYLELQADRVESVFASHRAPVWITGGTLGPRLIRFFVQPQPYVRLAQLRALAEDVAAALHTANVRITRSEDEGIVLEFANPNGRELALLTELRALGFERWPEGTAYLGLADSGAPLLARLASPEVAHILIAGTTGSGKSVLLRGMAASLVLGHAPDDLRVVAIDPKGRAFDALEGAPHLTQPAIREPQEAARTLGGLARLMEDRDARRESAPRIVVLIDELADLLMVDGGVEGHLTRLLQRGREAGIHVVAATQRPAAAVLSGLMRANFPLRLVGRVVSPEDARIASGRGGTGAELLGGRGDFLAVGAEVTRFQAALVDDEKARRAIGQRWPRQAAAFALPEGDAADVEVIDPAQADAERLAALDRENGPYRSNRQREMALCGYTGGQATLRVKRALEWQGATTTTPALSVLAVAGR